MGPGSARIRPLLGDGMPAQPFGTKPPPPSPNLIIEFIVVYVFELIFEAPTTTTTAPYDHHRQPHTPTTTTAPTAPLRQPITTSPPLALRAVLVTPGWMWTSSTHRPGQGPIRGRNHCQVAGRLVQMVLGDQ